jgi:Mrp family chromosome partitioning ATPase
MSRNSLVLEKAAEEQSLEVRHLSQPAASREYTELIRRLFPSPAAVAVVGTIPGEDVSGICAGLAKELANSGKRVLVASVEKLLRMRPIPVPDATVFLPGEIPNVWSWRTPPGPRLEIFRSQATTEGQWLDTLRRSFDSVVLDCSAVFSESGAAEVAALADAAVLIVEAGKTDKQRIKHLQQTLELKGAKVAGIVLVLPKVIL